MSWRRLNLPEIDVALAELAATPRIVADSEALDEPMTSDVVRRLCEGYRYIDTLLAERTEIFRYGASGAILEVNHRVLCGITPERRRQFADHIAETERWFYDKPDAGVGALFSWLQRHRGQPPVALAAGLFVHVVSHPQLFIEGNGRSAALLASYVLARAGLPPLVVTAEHYRAYHAVVERGSVIERPRLSSTFSIPTAVSRTVAFIRDSADPRFLCAAEPVGVA